MRIVTLALLMAMVGMVQAQAQTPQFAPAVRAAAMLRAAALTPSNAARLEPFGGAGAQAGSNRHEMGTTLMIAGGAAVLIGAIVGGGGGAALIVGGLAAGGYGYYLFQQK
ncbi:MAG TPA: hypothetical protein VLV45_00405 [Gemmatimonadales bacterium]|nr:hypothetical protein [Gemmatimonadales bacterium]